MDKELISNWRNAYYEMIVFANAQIKKEIRPYIEVYVYEELAKPSILRTIGKILSARLNQDEKEGDQAAFEVRINHRSVIPVYMLHAIKDNPDKANMLTALLDLFLATDSMINAANVSSKHWLLSVLKEFLDIYKSNPKISDVDAMVQYIQKEGVIKDSESLNYLSQETRDNLDLGLDAHLKAFVEQYAREYLNEDISLRGMQEE